MLCIGAVMKHRHSCSEAMEEILKHSAEADAEQGMTFSGLFR